MALETNLQIRIGSLLLPNPVMTASGTFGYGKEFEDFVNLHKLGAIIVKGISLTARPGNPPPRIIETSCGMLNSIGLENVGIDRFISEKLPYLQNSNCRVIVNILGDSIEEYCQLAERLDGERGVSAIELNISCPNVKKGGVAFGTDSKMANNVISLVKKHTIKPVIVKLSPNVTDIVEMALSVEEGGADAISLINTLIGMAIDVDTQKPVLANTIGGLSGPAIKPVALRMVWQVADSVNVPIIGIGGISTWEDAVEFILAGASAVQVGTANFYNPKATEDIITGVEAYMEKKNHNSLNDFIGAARR